jgi:hypothetical protein
VDAALNKRRGKAKFDQFQESKKQKQLRSTSRADPDHQKDELPSISSKNKNAEKERRNNP